MFFNFHTQERYTVFVNLRGSGRKCKVLYVDCRQFYKTYRPYGAHLRFCNINKYNIKARPELDTT